MAALRGKCGRTDGPRNRSAAFRDRFWSISGAASARVVAGRTDRRAVFLQNWATCRGDDGKGASSIGTAKFCDPTTQGRLNDEQIVMNIEDGKPGTMMAGWGGKPSRL
jgi:hypothetical protein